MAFDLIRINDFRNLTDCELKPDSTMNFIYGGNGSGKTSLLEAIYILSRGRSFRDKQLQNGVQIGKNSFTLFGIKTEQNKNKTIGINYSKKGANIRIEGERVSKLSVLARETPIHIITPRSQEIIENGSGIRRRFLDWGVFHVEPLFQHFLSRYHRALAQRNSALRENSSSVALWNRELVESGVKVAEYRKNYFQQLKLMFEEQLRLLDTSIELEMVLYGGWTSNKGLQEVLQDNFSGDEKCKYTRMGPHRADIIFKVKNFKLSKLASRGQIKLAVFGLFFAQANLIKSLSNKESILLVDDLSSELDNKNVDRLIDLMLSQKKQIFISTTDQKIRIPTNEGKMFHVEHGLVEEQSV
ncbi:MAG: DNA replication/repair protein RecF [Chromatiaceae bacterium]|nr:DNA replication/repair protein RecF [Chromatiaceae bacterium]